MFGSAGSQWLRRVRGRGAPDLMEVQELQVWITSPDPECDAHPGLNSDESCEFLRGPPRRGHRRICSKLELHELLPSKFRWKAEARGRMTVTRMFILLHMFMKR